MANYVHSTCGQSMVFKVHEPLEKENRIQAVKVIKEIRIGGGACVITADGRSFPKCVDTEVTDEELAFLEKDPAFQNMKRRGFITVNKEEKQVRGADGNPNDLNRKDYGCAQIEDVEHAAGTDPRTQEQTGLRATYGEGNQFGGKQPATIEDSDYGPIYVR